MSICDMCKHYDFVSWSYNKKGCTLAATNSGSDGYGPFYSHAKCVHDRDKSELHDLFEIRCEAEISRDKDIIRNQKDKIWQLEGEIQCLTESITKLAKGERE